VTLFSPKNIISQPITNSAWDKGAPLYRKDLVTASKESPKNRVFSQFYPVKGQIASSKPSNQHKTHNLSNYYTL